jgi:A/G-specific adenine glycosylase
MPDKDAAKLFRIGLMKWNKVENHRVMPWKGEKDPYKIWLSEIILQQTRVEQGTEYFNRFVSRFPDICKLAGADDKEVYKLWEGLGYYNRCKNLLITARFIAGPLKGKFPDTYPEILALKGVGTYTAAAIASFGFNLPYAVVDGNVYRVIARYFGIGLAVDSTAGKKEFERIAGLLLDIRKPGLYNQAIMDFGATVCKPVQPLCPTCALRKNCTARIQESVARLPVKEKKLKLRTRHFLYILFTYRKKLYVHRRPAGDIWENLYEFNLVETDVPREWTSRNLSTVVRRMAGHKDFLPGELSGPYRQRLSHQEINARFLTVKLFSPPLNTQIEALPVNQISTVPFPGIITKFLKHKNLYL